MAHDVFISHSSKDKVMADAICAGLEARGIRCWIAPRDVQPGEEWTRTIVDAITACKVFLLVFTANSNSSSQIVKELDCATRDQKTIIPFRIENIDPTGSMKYYLGSLHWLDALTPPIDSQIDQLGKYIRHILGFPQVAPGAIPTNLAQVKKAPARVKQVDPPISKADKLKLDEEKKKLNRLGMVVIILGVLILAVILLNRMLTGPAINKVPTLKAVTWTVEFTPLFPTEEPSPTVMRTDTQEFMSGILVKNANCREYTDEIAPIIELLKVSQTVNIQGRDDSASWLYVQVTRDTNEVLTCWVYASNIEIQSEGKPLPVFTQIPAHCYWLVNTDFTAQDGSKHQTTLKADSREGAIELADADCAWRLSVGNVSCIYVIGTKCDY